MANTTKPFSERDATQTQKLSFNDVDASTTTSGFLVGKVNREIQPTISTTSIANDTIVYSYLESDIELYAIECVYTDGTRTTLISAKRIR